MGGGKGQTVKAESVDLSRDLAQLHEDVDDAQEGAARQAGASVSGRSALRKHVQCQKPAPSCSWKHGHCKGRDFYLRQDKMQSAFPPPPRRPRASSPASAFSSAF